jgi:small-conductance mechanosensitive channel
MRGFLPLWQHERVITPRPTLSQERRASWITAPLALVLLVALVVVRPELLSLAPKRYHAEVKLGILLLAAVFGGIAIRAFVSRAFFHLRGTELSGWRPIVTWCLYVILAVGILSALDINLGGLLAAGAILGVVVGVAAQTSLASVFAGIVLVLARPYTVGSWVVLRYSIFGAYDYSGVITQVGVVYTTMDMGGRLVRVPNSAALASVLIVSHVPIQLDMELVLPPEVQLSRLHQELSESLQLGPGEIISLRPIRFTTEGAGLLTCQLLIRSHRTLDLAAVNRAIVASSAKLEIPEPKA